jgi:integrase
LYDEVHADRDYAPATVGVHRILWGDPEDREHPLYALRYRKAKTISREDVDTALRKIDKPAMKETRLLLSTLFSHAIAVHGLTTNPAKRLARPTTRAERTAREGSKKDDKRYLSDEELTRLVRAVPARYGALVHLMARVGLRPDEALALRVGKIDLLRRKLTIDTSTTGHTKTGEAREVTLPAMIAEELAEHTARYSDPKDPAALVCLAQDATMLSVGGFRHIFQRPPLGQA